MIDHTNSLREKIKALRGADKRFDRAHRTVQLFMLVWAVIIAADRFIGIATQAYDGNQKVYALVGALILIGFAVAGACGHVTLAMLVMQINMAVFFIQFIATCFFYTQRISWAGIIFYGVCTAVLIAFSLLLFLNRDLEDYREKLSGLKRKKERQPAYFRTNNRLVRNPRK